MPFPGDREFNVSMSYFERGKLRGFETPCWSPNAGAALSSAEKILRSGHPDATVHRSIVVDVLTDRLAKPRLVAS